MRETPADRQKILSPRHNAILAAAAFARVFIREAEREVQYDESEIWRATLQLAEALHAIPDDNPEDEDDDLELNKEGATQFQWRFSTSSFTGRTKRAGGNPSAKANCLPGDWR